MITVTVKLLNGEILAVQLPEGADLFLLKTILYREITTAPWGSLVLRRELPELEDGADEVAQLMIMGESLTSDVHDPSVVSYLVDEMRLVALIDTSIITPSVVKGQMFNISNRKGWIQKCDEYRVDFNSTIEMIEEESNVLSTVSIIHDVDIDKWALRTSFRPICSDAYFHINSLHKSTNETQWYPTPSECVLASSHRIPRDHDTLSEVQRIFDAEEWLDESNEDYNTWDDVQEYEPDYEQAMLHQRDE